MQNKSVHSWKRFINLPRMNRTFIPALILFGICGANGCSNESARYVYDLECSVDAHCSSRTDGFTRCDTQTHRCIEPQPGENVCGDGVLGGSEACDQTALNGKSCADFAGFVAGTLQCSNLCQFDTSLCVQCTDDNLSLCEPNQTCSNGQCITPEPAQLCGNDKLDEGEDCDGTLFANDKTLCSDWDNTYDTGHVGCSACAIDYSDCSHSAIVDKCADNQEWSDKYNDCVYPISTQQDLVDLAANWNQNGDADYPHTGDRPVFLVKNDITIENSSAALQLRIGDYQDQIPSWSDEYEQYSPEHHCFYGIFDGDQHTFTVSLNDADIYSGLFGDTCGAEIHDLTFDVNATNIENLVFYNDVKSSYQNITVTGIFKTRNEEHMYHYIFGDHAKGTTLDNIKIDSDVEVIRPSMISLFIDTLQKATVSNIEISGHVRSLERNHASESVNGFSREIHESGIWDVKIAVDYENSNEICTFAHDISGHTKLNNIQITSSVRLADDSNEVYFAKNTHKCEGCIISNLFDDVQVESGSDSTVNAIFIPYISNLTVANAHIRTNYNTRTILEGEEGDDDYEDYYMYAFQNVSIVNSLFTQALKALFTGNEVNSQASVFGDEIEQDNPVTAARMNEALLNHEDFLPSGTYLPWVDKGAEPYLNFEANESERIVFP